MSIMNYIDPIAFEVLGRPIYWYAIFITSAMIISLIAATLEANRRGVNSDFVLELFMWCIPLAIVFARIVYVLAHPASYFPIVTSEDFMELFRIDHGGLTIIGGILGGVLGAFIVNRYKKINLLDMMDFGLPFMLLGQALGRWGNYVNQELYGKVVTSEFFQRFPLGVYIDATNKWHYATFFYEMILNLIGFAVLYTIGRKTNRRGVVAFGYFIWYGMVRGILELIREDAIIINGFYLTMTGCFIAAAIGIILCVLILKGKINLGTSNLVSAATAIKRDNLIAQEALKDTKKENLVTERVELKTIVEEKPIEVPISDKIIEVQPSVKKAIKPKAAVMKPDSGVTDKPAVKKAAKPKTTAVKKTEETKD